MLREFEIARSPGGKGKLLADYLEQCRVRALELGQKEAVDTSSRLVRAGFPIQAVSALRNAQPRESLDQAKTFVADKFALFLVMLGERGLGKTVAAAYVAQEFARRFAWNEQIGGGIAIEPIRCIPASTLTRMSAFEKSDDDLLYQLERAGLLVVDDMGDEGTELGKATLVDLLIRRHGKGRRTVITSNLRGDAFKERYGAALADRIRSSGFVWEGKGKSMRGRYTQEARP